VCFTVYSDQTSQFLNTCQLTTTFCLSTVPVYGPKYTYSIYYSKPRSVRVGRWCPLPTGIGFGERANIFDRNITQLTYLFDRNKK